MLPFHDYDLGPDDLDRVDDPDYAFNDSKVFVEIKKNIIFWYHRCWVHFADGEDDFAAECGGYRKIHSTAARDVRDSTFVDYLSKIINHKSDN